MGPQQIGPYRIVAKLGQGGMGEVFEAIHEVIERRVAIKVLAPDRAREPEAAARFFNEARAVNRIEHPGLVQVSDYGQTPDGSLYIVMELLVGETLSQRARRVGRLPADEVVGLGRQIASALVAAHDKGIIHRDLKPANLMLVADPETASGERVKLLDFGIAKLTHASDQGSFHTNSDVLLGTPRYMSPEQCRGNREVDDRSDVYSLGVVLYLLLAGRPPFESAGSGELIAMHIYEPVPPLGPLAPEAPAPLVALCHRMLAKDKAERPSMREVLAALDALGGSPLARRGSSQSLPRRSAGALLGASASTPPGLAAHDQPPTLSAVTGPTDLDDQRPLRRRLAAGFAAGLALSVALGAAWMQAASAPASAAPGASAAGGSASAAPAASAARVVRWSVQSQPPGADVVRASDGAVLGQTPWASEAPAADGAVELRLRRPGFAERRLSLDQGRDAHRDEILDPAPGAAPAAAAPRPGRPARPATPTTSRPGRIDVED